MTKKNKPILRDKIIGNQLGRLRIKYSLSMEELAELANVDYKTIWNCENGYNSLTLDLIIKLSFEFNRRYGINLETLFEWLIIEALEKEQLNN